MFKRITSNRDPEATIWKELRREFGGYFIKTGNWLKALCLDYPNTVFGLMLALLVLSTVFSFFVSYHPGQHPAPAHAVQTPKPDAGKSPHPHPLDDGFSRILETGATLRQTLALKKEVETTLAKGRLSHADSLVLEHALDSLRQLQHQIH